MNGETMKKWVPLALVAAIVLVIAAVGVVVGLNVSSLNDKEAIVAEAASDSSAIADEKNIIKNSGFENGPEGSSTPYEWEKYCWSDHDLAMYWERSEVHGGKRSVCISNTETYGGTEVCNNWVQKITGINKVAGTKMQFTGWMKTENVDGIATFCVDCWDSQGNQISIINTEHIKGTTGWMHYSKTVDIPKNASEILVRGTLTGTGNVWFDDLALVPI
ncbi:MAG: hypothetical protein CVT48_06160 [Thermoplasmata archaeon HGW-Thermoplasmata-1]|nr:MAG: hypothetical protein CVT48_06160 [Thermoplasmata archaeon HGW-Thermoplasmata-1]